MLYPYVIITLGWWGSGDSNPDAFRHMILSHARLPIPALPRQTMTILAQGIEAVIG